MPVGFQPDAALALSGLSAESLFDVLIPLIFMIFWIISAMAKGDKKRPARPQPDGADETGDPAEDLRRFLEQVSEERGRKQPAQAPATEQALQHKKAFERRSHAEERAASEARSARRPASPTPREGPAPPPMPSPRRPATPTPAAAMETPRGLGPSIADTELGGADSVDAYEIDERPRRRAVPPGRTWVLAALRQRSAAQRAIVLRDVLGAPVAMRRPGS